MLAVALIILNPFISIWTDSSWRVEVGVGGRVGVAEGVGVGGVGWGVMGVIKPSYVKQIVIWYQIFCEYQISLHSFLEHVFKSQIINSIIKILLFCTIFQL